MSAQVSYNLPMDMEANILFVDAPECESLQFQDDIDGYRQFSGAANLAGKRVILNEMGAEIFKAYQLTIPRLLGSVNRAFAGGVIQLILHGQSFTGNYYGTTWPGYTAFSYLFSESYSNKQPPTGGSADGAYVKFSNVLHAIRVYVNGQHIPPVDYTAPEADIGQYLKDGRNEILAIVPTTMWNYLRSIFAELRNSGTPPLLTSLGAMPGPVDKMAS